MTTGDSDNTIFWMSYPPDARSGRKPKSAHQRDGGACAELLVQLMTMGGFVDWEVLFNFPASHVLVDLLRFRTGDIILQTTRAPVHDDASEDRRHMKASHSDLEQIIRKRLLKYFTELRRSAVILAPEYAVLLEPGYETRACLQIERQPGATIQAWKPFGPGDMRPTGGPKRTAAYFLHTPPLWKNGPRLILAFGMSSDETYAWARILRRQYPEIVRSGRPRFVMGELIPAPVPMHPIDGRWADQWRADIILDVPLPLPAKLRREAERRMEAIATA